MSDREPPSQQPTTQPSLDDAEAAFERGDFARMSGVLRRLPPESAESERARKLAHAVTPDAVHLLVLVLCLIGFAAIAMQYLK